LFIFVKKIEDGQEFRKEFDESVQDLLESQGAVGLLMDEARYKKVLEEVIEAKSKTKSKTSKDYRRMALYETVDVDGATVLVNKKAWEAGKTLYYVTTDKLFDILYKCHLDMNHRKTQSRIFTSRGGSNFNYALTLQICSNSCLTVTQTSPEK
jgi:hypothetical protein